MDFCDHEWYLKSIIYQLVQIYLISERAVIILFLPPGEAGQLIKVLSIDLVRQVG